MSPPIGPVKTSGGDARLPESGRPGVSRGFCPGRAVGGVGGKQQWAGTRQHDLRLTIRHKWQSNTTVERKAANQGSDIGRLSNAGHLKAAFSRDRKPQPVPTRELGSEPVSDYLILVDHQTDVRFSTDVQRRIAPDLGTPNRVSWSSPLDDRRGSHSLRWRPISRGAIMEILSNSTRSAITLTLTSHGTNRPLIEISTTSVASSGDNSEDVAALHTKSFRASSRADLDSGIYSHCSTNPDDSTSPRSFPCISGVNIYTSDLLFPRTRSGCRGCQPRRPVNGAAIRGSGRIGNGAVDQACSPALQWGQAPTLR